MRRLNWETIRSALRERQAAPAPAPAAEFWADFHRRAAQVHQARVAPVPVVDAFRWRVAFAAAAVVFLIGAVAFLPMFRPGPEFAGPAVSSVEQVEGFGSPYMIVNDEQSGGALVWVYVESAEGG